MKFTLVWQGDLPSSGNSNKPQDVARIRRELSPQLEVLWQTHAALQTLKENCYRRKPETLGNTVVDQSLRSPRDWHARFPQWMEDLCCWLPLGDRTYLPLVRKSLDLTCGLKILFLRQEEVGKLVLQGGDLDGRIKTLLDALKMPKVDDKHIPGERLCCLMQEDALVSSLDVDTERLLFPQKAGHEGKHEVFLVIEVTLHVLRVTQENYCLL
jgi:hypothetical protein